MQNSFQCFSDPGHGWAKVPEGVIKALGMRASDFSRYSYVDKGHMFLEEDCDLSLFAKKYREVVGKEAKFPVRHCNGQSRVRSKWDNNPEAVRYFVPSIAD